MMWRYFVFGRGFEHGTGHGYINAFMAAYLVLLGDLECLLDELAVVGMVGIGSGDRVRIHSDRGADWRAGIDVIVQHHEIAFLDVFADCPQRWR